MALCLSTGFVACSDNDVPQKEIIEPNPVATGTSAFLNACAQIARRRVAPLAITVRT